MGPPVSPGDSTDRLFAARVFREEAKREGFARVGFARVETPPRFDRFRDWLASGRHAGMAYLKRTFAVRQSPERLLPGARSIVCLAAAYPAEPFASPDGAMLARYARGADYHGTLRSRALRVARRAAKRIGAGFRFRVCVDSTPLSERSFAAAAGLGWIGKNGCLIDPEYGSYLLLAEIMTDLDMPPDDPIAEQCGSCVRCLNACPTEAFLEPGLLDAERCLAYWTIEHRGAIPDRIKSKIGDRVFGCDICQEVCPWNGPLRLATAIATDTPETAPPTRGEWLAMGPGEWRRRFGATALNRAGRRGLQRNAAASAGSCGVTELLPVLRRAAQLKEAGLSEAARWALRQLEGDPP